MNNRVVITGLGVVSPNGVGLEAFTAAIKAGVSGIKYIPALKDLKFACCIGGIPEISEEKKREYFTDLQLRGFNSSGILYGCMAGMDAWRDAGLEVSDEMRRLGSTAVLQTMASGVSAYLGGMIGLGNQVTTNSSACTTGTEAIMMGYDRIKAGRAKRMLVGSCSDHGPYLWGGFDALRVLPSKYNDNPTAASRPMSATASGFVPGSGAGALVLETLGSALERGATIYAEVLGGEINSGGQRKGGSMTAPNTEAVQRCISRAIEHAGIEAKDIDAINGHLTATIKDATEIDNWSKALGLTGADFPHINSIKSMIGHCIAASGAIESVASVLQIQQDFVFPNINCEDLNEAITDIIDADKIPQKLIEKEVNIVAKASFGFGDVNGVVIFKKI